MPKEHKKRGRRELAKKRKREHAEEESRPKKSRKWEEGPDEYIPISDEAAQDEGVAGVANPGEETPFYGLLDDEEQEYFKRADEMLELNRFSNPQERELFLANVYREGDGKELKLACSQSCSRLLERLVMLSTPAQLKKLFKKFNGHFLHLIQHRFASHCCEALFIQSAPVVTRELLEPLEEQDEPASDEPYVSMENLFLYTVNELEGNLGYLMTERFASHPLRVLLTVLSGGSLSQSPSRSLLRSKRKEKIQVDGVQSQNGATLEKRKVPDSFHAALDKMIVGSVAGLDTTFLRALATHPTGNPTLQLLLQLELTQYGKQRAKDEQSIIRRLLPDDPFKEGSGSAHFVDGMIYDPVGSRLLETIIQFAPGKMFKSMYRESFKSRLGTLARSDVAGYVVSTVLERLSKEDLEEAVSLILPEIPALVDRNRTAVIKTIVERCAARQVDTSSLAVELEQAYSGTNGFAVTRLLKASDAGPEGDAPADGEGNAPALPEKTHGSLLAQAMVAAPGALSRLIFNSLAQLGTPLALKVARDPTASRAIQAALASEHASVIFRRKMIQQFYGHIGEMALDPSASHVIDSIWNGTQGLAFIRERIAEELAENEASLRESFVGRAVWRNWQMDLYKRRRAEWVRRSRNNAGSDGFQPFPDDKQVGKPKLRPIDLAMQRHAAAKANREKKQRLSQQHKGKEKASAGDSSTATSASASASA